MDVKLGLLEAETASREPDWNDLAGPIDTAAGRLNRRLDASVPILLQREDLKEAATRSERVLSVLTTLSSRRHERDLSSDAHSSRVPWGIAGQ
jgi:hypothetical protein